MKKIFFSTYILCILIIFITSCSSLNKSKPENPIIPDNSRGLTTFAINPSRRLVIVKPVPPPIEHQDIKEKGLSAGRFDIFLDKKICGEPPPDVSDNIASELSLALSANGEFADKGSAGFASELARTLNTTAVLLFKRTQGLQLFRDGMYHLCLAKMNDFVNEVYYQELARTLLEQSVRLISEEIPLIKAAQDEVLAQKHAVPASETKKVVVSE